MKDYSVPTFKVLTKNLPITTVTLYGDMFNFKTLNGLYLSSANVSMSSVELNLYTDTKSISARYPAVSAFPVLEFFVLDEYKVQFKLPTNLLAGNYDILYFNDAGYVKASSSDRFTYFQVITSV